MLPKNWNCGILCFHKVATILYSNTTHKIQLYNKVGRNCCNKILSCFRIKMLIVFDISFCFQFLKFIQQMCSILNIEAITADIGMDMSFESILSRCEQLIRAEYDWGEDKKLQLHNQTRKIKALKEQLQSKELHLDLLRKKARVTYLYHIGQINNDKMLDV